MRELQHLRSKCSKYFYSHCRAESINKHFYCSSQLSAEWE